MKCEHCGEEITAQERAADNMHIECLSRLVLGSAAHQMHQCSCYGGTMEDPPEMTKRQAARAAFTVGLHLHVFKRKAMEN